MAELSCRMDAGKPPWGSEACSSRAVGGPWGPVLLLQPGTGQRGAPGAAPVAGIAHLPGDRDRLRLGWGMAVGSSNTGLTVWGAEMGSWAGWGSPGEAPEAASECPQGPKSSIS